MRSCINRRQRHNKFIPKANLFSFILIKNLIYGRWSWLYSSNQRPQVSDFNSKPSVIEKLVLSLWLEGALIWKATSLLKYMGFWQLVTFWNYFSKSSANWEMSIFAIYIHSHTHNCSAEIFSKSCLASLTQFSWILSMMWILQPLVPMDECK